MNQQEQVPTIEATNRPVPPSQRERDAYVAEMVAHLGEVRRQRNEARAEIIEFTRALHELVGTVDGDGMLPHWRVLLGRVAQLPVAGGAQ